MQQGCVLSPLQRARGLQASGGSAVQQLLHSRRRRVACSTWPLHAGGSCAAAAVHHHSALVPGPVRQQRGLHGQSLQLQPARQQQRQQQQLEHSSRGGAHIVPRTLFHDGAAAAAPSPGGNGSNSSSRSGGGSKQQQQQQQQQRQAALDAAASAAGSGSAAAAVAAAAAAGGSGGGSLRSFVGASAKQLLASAVHSLDLFEPSSLRDSTGVGGPSSSPAWPGTAAGDRSGTTTTTGSSFDDDFLASGGGGGFGSSSGGGGGPGPLSSVGGGGGGLGSGMMDSGMDSFEEAGMHSNSALATAHIVKANYEVLRLDEAGAVRRLRIKRRDLLREHRLQPRDLRRIDPSIDFTKASPSITIKEDVLLLNLGGLRAIVTADKALLFEPASSNTRKLLDTLVPRLQASAGQRLLARQQADGDGSSGSNGGSSRQAGSRAPPFELEVLEGVLMVATGRLDAEVLAVTRRVGELLQKLPRDINPVNLEELRRIKQALVELENKADMLREMLEQIMDDEDELREINLSSRPRREERRKQRERERMERQLTRAREEMEEQARRNSGAGDSDDRRSSSSGGSGGGGSTGGGIVAADGSSSSSAAAGASSSSSSSNSSNGSGNGSSSVWLQQQPAQVSPLLPPSSTQQQLVFPNAPGTPRGREGQPLPGSSGSSSTSSSGGRSSGGGGGGSSARQQRLAELYARHGLRRGPGGVLVPAPGGAGRSGGSDSKQPWGEDWRPALDRDGLVVTGRGERDRDRDRDRDRERDDPEEEFQDAQDALEELAEQEEEEEELEEVEDLLEYYLQRGSATQSEAERLLEGARDLEESIGVSLSARRYEVNRLELMLSMGSFAAALGAMIAGIFGMNMKSTLEMSVFGFWGVSGCIVIGCFYIFLAIMQYTQKKRIL